MHRPCVAFDEKQNMRKQARTRNDTYLALMKLFMTLQQLSPHSSIAYDLQEPHILRVAENSPHEQLGQASVDFLFPYALLPQAVLTSEKGDNHLTVISAGGILYSVHLASSSRAGPEASVLHGKPRVLSLSLQVGISWSEIAPFCRVISSPVRQLFL